MLDDAELDAIEARANAATEGPWWRSMDGDIYRVEDDEGEFVATEPVVSTEWRQGAPTRQLLLSQANAEFIARSREDVPALLRDLRAARQQLALPVQDADLREKIAQAIYDVRDDPYDDTEWSDLSSADKERYHCDADAALAVLHPAQDKWEYGTEYEVSSTETVFTPTHSREQAEKWVAESPTDTGLRRRRPAGPWQPVPDEGGNGS